MVKFSFQVEMETDIIIKKIICMNTCWRIQKGVIKPRDPKEKGTIGGTGPLNIEAAFTFST